MMTLERLKGRRADMIVRQIVLMVLALTLLYIFSRSFIKDPYSYRNTLIIAGVIFLVSLLLDGGDHTPVVGLIVPLCLLSLFVCISNVSLFFHEGHRLQNLLGFLFLSAYLITINILWFKITEVPEVITPVMIFVRLFFCYLECTILAICLMGYAVLQIKPAYDKDFIIILGCSISKKGKLRPLIKQRVNRAIHFAWEQEWNEEKSARYVPSGGQGSDEPMSEGSAMALYLLSHGAEDYEVIPEKESRNTRENLIFSKKIIEDLRDKDKKAKTAVVTSNYHVLRSGYLAKAAGLDFQVVGCPVKWYFWPNAFFRETVAILFMNTKTHAAAAVICAIAAVILKQAGY